MCGAVPGRRLRHSPSRSCSLHVHCIHASNHARTTTSRAATTKRRLTNCLRRQGRDRSPNVRRTWPSGTRPRRRAHTSSGRHRASWPLAAPPRSPLDRHHHLHLDAVAGTQTRVMPRHRSMPAHRPVGMPWTASKAPPLPSGALGAIFTAEVTKAPRPSSEFRDDICANVPARRSSRFSDEERVLARVFCRDGWRSKVVIAE